jgi:Universal stress protein UspA and related nucleotide-binding proteins
MCDSILLPTDGGEEVQEAVGEAIDMAEFCGATLHVIDVVNTTEVSVAHDIDLANLEQSIEDAGSDAVEAVVSGAAGRGLNIESALLRGTPPKEILGSDENAIGLVVMGTRGHTGMDRILLGSVAEAVVRNAT